MDTGTVTEETQKEGAAKVPEQAAAASAPMSTKRPRREDRNRKDDRNYDMFMKTVNAAPPSEQLNIATQKYVAMLDENKKMQFYIKQSDKRHAIILKEKEQLQLEFNKTILLKSKLENLCRELQKQNKSIKEESLHKIREEEERRKETQAKFQNTLAEISNLLQQNNEKNAKLRDDNISMTEKFKSVVQQYQTREDQVEKMKKQLDLEGQLNAAKMQKASLEHQAERERLMAEVEILKNALMEYRNKINEMSGTETGLRGQLAVYTDKYDEFQSALMKSNQVFGGFKDQMEKMSKKIKQLEKESVSWKQRFEVSQSALLEMCGERQQENSRLLAIQRQLTHMQSLCRTLQAERTVLLGTLKENNIERPPLPAPAPAPAPEPLPPARAAPDAKMDAMAVNCAQLRKSVAHLQSQLNDLTTQQTQPEEPAQPEKPKKNKNKKNKAKKLAEEPKRPTEEPKGSTGESKGPTEEAKETKEVSSIKVKTENEDAPKKDNDDVNTRIQSVDLAAEKVDENVLESLMQAINLSNVNLCNLEVVDDNNISIEEVLDTEAKVIEITDETEAKVIEITDETDPKVIEITDETDPKVLEITDKPDSKVTENGVAEANNVIDRAETVKQVVPESPKKAESPKGSPKKAESPKGSPKKVESPKGSPKKLAVIVKTEEKDNKNTNIIDVPDKNVK